MEVCAAAALAGKTSQGDLRQGKTPARTPALPVFLTYKKFLYETCLHFLLDPLYHLHYGILCEGMRLISYVCKNFFYWNIYFNWIINFNSGSMYRKPPGY